jgi:acetylornithine/succinyldiaminopimelate/putrescine aminotransferase
MIGIELDVPGRPVVERALEWGLLINCTHDTVLRLLPPYVLTRAQADEIVSALDAALTSVYGS